MASSAIENQTGRLLRRAYTAFGVIFSADFDLPGVESVPTDDSRLSCELRLTTDPQPGQSADTHIFEERYENGVVRLTSCADGSFRSSSSAHGDFHVSADGATVDCLVDDRNPWQWRRYLIGQVMPLVALLKGLETIHASAVAIGGGAILVAGPSRVGKTSVAVHLIAGGGRLLADDVVALERVGDGVVAHPALGIIGVRHEECRRIGAAGLSKLGATIWSNEKEVLLAVKRVERPQRIRSVYLPQHTGLDGETEFVACSDPRFLLGGTYNNVLKSPDRVTTMLDVYSAVSRTAHVHQVRVPLATGAAELAEAIVRHDRATGC